MWRHSGEAVGHACGDDCLLQGFEKAFCVFQGVEKVSELKMIPFK